MINEASGRGNHAGSGKASGLLVTRRTFQAAGGGETKGIVFCLTQMEAVSLVRRRCRIAWLHFALMDHPEGDAFGEGTDGQRGINGKGGGNQRSVRHKKSRVAPHGAAMVSDTGLLAFAHEAAAQRMRGEQFPEGPAPQQAGNVLAVEGRAQALQSQLNLGNHLPALAMTPVHLNPAVFELEASVGTVGPHAQIGQEAGGDAATKQPLRLKTDPALSDAERGLKISDERVERIPQTTGARDGAFEKPDKGLGKTKVFNEDTVVFF